MLVGMEAEHRSEGRRYAFSARFNRPPKADGSGGASAAVDASTQALVVVGAFGVAGLALVMLNQVTLVMLSQGVELGRVQGAVPELLKRVGSLVAAAA